MQKRKFRADAQLQWRSGGVKAVLVLEDNETGQHKTKIIEEWLAITGVEGMRHQVLKM